METTPRALEFSRFLTGRMLRIIAGAERQTLFVHEPILSTSESPQFRALVNGAWKESGGEIDWSKTDVETVKRVLTYLYTGTYEAPDPEIIGSSQIDDSEVPEVPQPGDATGDATGDTIGDEVAQGEDGPIQSLAEDGLVGFSAEETSPFQEDTLSVVEMRPLTPVRRCLATGMPVELISTAAGNYANSVFSSAERRFGELLLTHARLYAFSRLHLVTGLESLALQRLTQVLVSLDTSYAHIVSDFVQLIRYVYDCEDIDNPKESIRNLVSQFAAINITDLKGDDFETLLSEGGLFVPDLTRKVSRRLLTSAACSGSLEQQIEDLEKKNAKLEETITSRDASIARQDSEIVEWQSWKRGSNPRMRGRKWGF